MVLPLAHVTRGPGEALGLLFVSAATVFGVAAFILFDSSRERPRRRPVAKGAAVLTAVSVMLAYASPLLIKGTWPAKRPAATARLEILSPEPGAAFRGDPAMVPVRLRLVGGKVVPSTSAKAVANVGHIHVYLDGRLISMPASLTDRVAVGPGKHTLEADFVATDHGPFNPPVRAAVWFVVSS